MRKQRKGRRIKDHTMGRYETTKISRGGYLALLEAKPLYEQGSYSHRRRIFGLFRSLRGWKKAKKVERLIEVRWGFGQWLI